MKFLVMTDIHCGYNQNTYKILYKFFTRVSELYFDAVIICGDVGSHKQKNIHTFFRLIRDRIPDKPIMCVFGNHDMWDYASFNKPRYAHKKKYYKFSEMEADRIKHAELNNITLLHENPQMFGNILVAGYDSWYINGIPKDSNDNANMYKMAHGKLIDDYLCDRAYDGLNHALNSISSDMTGIIVTHHNFHPMRGNRHGTRHGDNWCQNPRYFDFIASAGFAYCLYGHTHEEADFVDQGVRCINVGSNYNAPKFTILDI